MKSNIILTIVLCILPIWWIFRILWLPGFMHAVADFSYHFEDTYLPQASIFAARERAYEYATRPGSSSDDIFFTASEIAHLQDVERLYTPISRTFDVLAIIAWPILFLALYKRMNIDSPLMRSSKILCALSAIVLLSCVFFSSFFIYFHKVLFPQGNWAFPTDSVLIQIFPETFWRLELVTALLLLFIICLLYFLLSMSMRVRHVTE